MAFTISGTQILISGNETGLSFKTWAGANTLAAKVLAESSVEAAYQLNIQNGAIFDTSDISLVINHFPTRQNNNPATDTGLWKCNGGTIIVKGNVGYNETWATSQWNNVKIFVQKIGNIEVKTNGSAHTAFVTTSPYVTLDYANISLAGISVDVPNNKITIGSNFLGNSIEEVAQALFKMANDDPTNPYWITRNHTPAIPTKIYNTTYVDFGNINIVLQKSLTGALFTTGTFNAINNAACMGRVVASNYPLNGDWMIDVAKKELRYGGNLISVGNGTINVDAAGIGVLSGGVFPADIVGKYIQFTGVSGDKRVCYVLNIQSGKITLKNADGSAYGGGLYVGTWRYGAIGETQVNISTLAMCPVVEFLRVGDGLRADISLTTDWRIYLPEAYSLLWDIKVNTPIKYNLISLRVPGSINGGLTSSGGNNAFYANLHIAGPLLLDGLEVGGTDGVTAFSEYLFYQSRLVPAPSTNYGEYYAIWLGNANHVINGGRMDIGASAYFNGSSLSLINGMRWIQPSVSFNAIVFATTGIVSNIWGYSRLHSWARVPTIAKGNNLVAAALANRLDTQNVVFDSPILKTIAGADVRLTGLMMAKFRNPDTSKLDCEIANVYSSTNTPNIGGTFELTQTFSGTIKDVAGVGLSGVFWVPDTYNSGKRRNMTTGTSGKNFIPDAPNTYIVSAGNVSGEFLIAAYALNKPPFLNLPSKIGTISISADGLVTATDPVFTHGDYCLEMILMFGGKRYGIKYVVNTTQVQIFNADGTPYADGPKTAQPYDFSPPLSAEVKDSRGSLIRSGYFFNHTHQIVKTDIKTETNSDAFIEVKSDIDNDLNGKSRTYIESLQYLADASDVMGAHKIWRVDNKKITPLITRDGVKIKTTYPIILNKNATRVFDFNNNLLTLKSNVFVGDIEAPSITLLNGAILKGNVMGVLYAPVDNMDNVNATNLVFNDDATKTIVLKNCRIDLVKNEAQGVITIYSEGTTFIRDYTNPQINYINARATIMLPETCDIFSLHQSDADADNV